MHGFLLEVVGFAEEPRLEAEELSLRAAVARPGTEPGRRKRPAELRASHATRIADALGGILPRVGAPEFVQSSVRQGRALDRTEHRPWPAPGRRWRLGQTWQEMLFAHWELPAETLLPHLPDGLELDTFDARAWLGITPFRLTDLRARGLLPAPWLSSFLELNVRTYVTDGGQRPGIWFFSLDASSSAAVEAARFAYRLPYFLARMSAAWSDGWLSYECARSGEPGRVFSGRYRPSGDMFEPEPGTLEHFLTERYCLYTTDRRGALWRAEIHHEPWSLQPAEAEIGLTTISLVELADEPALLHYSKRQDVVIWPLERV
jgi:hypothetical protein